MPKRDVMSRVTLKAMRRPSMSEPMPQVKLPKQRPRKRYEVV